MADQWVGGSCVGKVGEGRSSNQGPLPEALSPSLDDSVQHKKNKKVP